MSMGQMLKARCSQGLPTAVTKNNSQTMAFHSGKHPWVLCNVLPAQEVVFFPLVLYKHTNFISTFALLQDMLQKGQQQPVVQR